MSHPSPTPQLKELPTTLPARAQMKAASTPLNRRSENVIVEAIVIPKLELRNVKWQIFGTNLVERADDTALEDAPETFNGLGVHRTDHVLAFGMVNGGVREIPVQSPVADPLIGAEQTNLVRNGFVDEALKGSGPDVRDNPRNDVALALDSASDDCLTRSGRAGLAVALIPMPVLCLPADECFVHLNDTAKRVNARLRGRR
jgi:hypothetical protein